MVSRILNLRVYDFLTPWSLLKAKKKFSLAMWWECSIPFFRIYLRWFRIFQTSRYQGIVKATLSGVFEDLKFKISEGSDQNWSCPESALLAVSVRAESGQLQFWSKSSESLNLRSSNTPESVAFTIPWCLKKILNHLMYYSLTWLPPTKDGFKKFQL